jgi:hypothetical protein
MNLQIRKFLSLFDPLYHALAQIEKTNPDQ